MLRVGADDPHHALAVDHLAFITHLFDRSSNFHLYLLGVGTSANAARKECVRYKFTSATAQFFRGPDRGAITPPPPDLPAALA